MRTVVVIILLILFGFNTQAQTKTFYYTDHWQIAPKEKASYYRVCSIDSNSRTGLSKKQWFVGDVKDYSMDGVILMTGSYTTTGVKTGEFIFYYPSGQVQAKGNFKDGLRDGNWKYYFENGNLERDVNFTSTGFEPISAYDSIGTALIREGTGQWHYEYEWYGQSEHYVVDGKFEMGKKEGIWTCSLSTGQLLYREVYKNNKFKEGLFFNGENKEPITQPFDNKFMLPFKFEVTEKFLTLDASEALKNKITVSTHRDTIPEDQKVFYAVEQQAEFPGGLKGLSKFLVENIKYPSQARNKKIQGKVFVKFIVHIDGSITNIEVIKGIHPALDQEAIRIVSIFPNWIPGRQSGKAVKSQFVLPIYFAIDD